MTVLSNSSPTTSVSVERCSKRRMLSSPVVYTCPASTLVTLVIGTKMRRRPKTSATMPSTRGWLDSDRRATTRSRTLATWSPWGSKIGSPISRAA